MPPTDQVARRFYTEVLSQHNLDVIPELFSADFIDHDPGNVAGAHLSIDGVREEVTGYITGFPDMQVTVDDALVEGDRVVLRAVMTGTHLGDFFGIPATGAPVRATAIQVFRVVDGKLAESWLELDRFNILRQMGLIP